MAKIICAYSSVEFQCEHLPVALSSREVKHPIFSIPPKRLLSLAAQWSLSKLTPTESYLLYLALLDSTSLIEWRMPATYTDKSASIIAGNMEQLIHIISKIDMMSKSTILSLSLPQYVMGKDTRDLSNSYYWIKIWNSAYQEWQDGIREHINDQESYRRELALEKLIKSSHKRIEDYPRILANWARVAGNFPTHLTLVGSKQIELSEYWESIIIKCSKEEAIINIPQADIEELIEHCVDNIVHEGSIHAMALMKHLRRGLSLHKNYLSLGDIDLAGKSLTGYRILSPETSAEDANIQNMIDAAPDKEPTRINYPNLVDYIKARSRWNIAQAHKKPESESEQS